MNLKNQKNKHEKPISIPLSFEEAVGNLLAVKPPLKVPQTEDKKTKKKNQL